MPRKTTTQTAALLIAEFTEDDLEQLRPECREMVLNLKRAFERERLARRKGQRRGWSKMTAEERHARMAPAFTASPGNKPRKERACGNQERKG